MAKSVGRQRYEPSGGTHGCCDERAGDGATELISLVS
jgi:hypothetical protein